jgi:glycosyltransferase involved in cell wall biosynthesis
MDNLRLLAPVSRPINYILKSYGARFHSKADFITMPTQSAIEMFNVEKITTPMAAVSNGIDLSRFTVGRADDDVYERFNIPKDQPIISYVGRLDAEKHLPVLMRAFVRVQSIMPHVHLVIVGDGTERPILKSLAHDLGVSHNVTLTGRVSDEDLVSLHKVGTVFCMPSPAELQSIATLEAMASGQPVVAVDAGALRELCQHERNGYLTEQDNDEMIAKGLVAILEDEALREEMSQESLAIARTHDLQTTLQRFEQIYTDLINA